MGQKINPTGFRVGVYGEHKGWLSRWYASKKEFGKLLKEDYDIREFLKAKHQGAAISKIEIERVGVGSEGDTKKYRIVVHIHTGRPGVLIGKKGAKLGEIEGSLKKLTGQQVSLQVKEIREQELDAQLLADSAAEQLAKRSSFRRTMKNILKLAKDKGALGCRIKLAGRLGGAEMARRETAQFGSIPLQTLLADVDYAHGVSRTTHGVIGVKVWVYRGTLVGAPGAEPRKVLTPSTVSGTAATSSTPPMGTGNPKSEEK